ncbi:MAG: helix-turn-helix domain-containing protein [Bacteroidales bacterium]
MNKHIIYSELFLRVEFLVLLIYLILMAYMIYIVAMKKEIPEKECGRLKTLTAGFAGITLLFLFKQIVFQITGSDGVKSLQSLTSLTVLQLIIPVYLYFYQKNINPGLKLFKPMLLVLTLFSFNIAMFLINNLIEERVVWFVVKLTAYFIIIFSFTVNFMIWSEYKKKDSKYFKENFSRDGELFPFMSNSLLSVILSILIINDSGAIITEGTRYLITLVNFSLFLKVIYPYSWLGKREIQNVSDERQIDIQGVERRSSDDKKINELRDRLVIYFEKEKPYLKPDLTIYEVALYLYSNKTYLSRVINECFDNNFNQFVNYYRVEEAKRLFKSDMSMNIHQMCDLAGFGSMATFSIAFRYYVGNSPAEWCKEQRILCKYEDRATN